MNILSTFRKATKYAAIASIVGVIVYGVLATQSPSIEEGRDLYDGLCANPASPCDADTNNMRLGYHMLAAKKDFIGWGSLAVAGLAIISGIADVRRSGHAPSVSPRLPRRFDMS